MVQRENTVFLTHKAGFDVHDIQDDKVHELFMLMLYTASVSSPQGASDTQREKARTQIFCLCFLQVFVGTMLCCFTIGCSLSKREQRKEEEEQFIKERNARVAFEADD